MRTSRLLRGSVSAAAIASLLAFAVPAAAQEADMPETGAMMQDTAAPVQVWDMEATDVQPDPAVTYGTLSNGMKYAIRKNDVPEGSASFRLRFEFGSLYEAEDERGLAHFIEHMAFNGTTNVPEGEMIPLLERQGLAFGPDTNASTGFDATTYMLDVPNANEEGVETAMFLLRETASEITFAPDAVDREREVIIGERRARDSAQLRRLIDALDFTVPDTLYDDRLPIGLNDVLRTAPAERFKALYNRYYRPENATFVAVGDFDVAEMEAMIQERFGDWQGVGPAGAKPEYGTVDLTRTASVDSFVDSGIPEFADITVMRPYVDEPDTVANRQVSLLDSLVTGMMSQRFDRIASAPDSILLNAGMNTSEYEPAAELTSMVAVTRDGEWQAGLSILEQELRRALQFGFTQAELDYVLTNTEASYRLGAEQAGARSNAALASGLVSLGGETSSFATDPAWRYAMFQQIKPTLTLDAVNARMQELWNGSAPLIHVSSKTELEGGDEAILATLGASSQVAVAPPEDREVAAFAYDTFGDGPGTVVSDTMIEDLGIRTIRFDNNVMLNIKQTDFEPGVARYNIRMDGGQFALGGDDPASIGLLLAVAGQLGGTVAHSFEELQQIVAGKQVGLGFAAGTDSFGASGATNAADLDLQMKLAAAYLTDYGFRPEAQARFEGSIDPILGNLLQNPGTVLAINSDSIFTDDVRFAFPSREQLMAASLESLREPLNANAADAAVEISIVGDIDPDVAIAAVAQSFGAMPTRKAEFETYEEVREVAFKTDLPDEPVTFVHNGPADQAVAGSVWRTADDGDYREELGLDLLGEVMSLRALEKLREELGATYSPSVSSSMSSDFEDWGTFGVSAVVAPDAVDDVLAIMPELAERLRNEPIDDDLLLRARQPMMERVRLARENNGFWSALAGVAQGEPDRLDRARQQADILGSFTPADLQALAVKFLTPERRADIRVVSDKAE